MFWFFGHKSCGILAPQIGIGPAPSALEAKVLTTDCQGSSFLVVFQASGPIVQEFACLA